MLMDPEAASVLEQNALLRVALATSQAEVTRLAAKLAESARALAAPPAGPEVKPSTMTAAEAWDIATGGESQAVQEEYERRFATPPSGSPPADFRLAVVVNGQPAEVTASVGMTMRQVVEVALKETGQVGRPVDEWRVRYDEDELLLDDAIVKPFPPDTRLWMFLGVGMCASGSPPGAAERKETNETVRDLPAKARLVPTEELSPMVSRSTGTGQITNLSGVCVNCGGCGRFGDGPGAWVCALCGGASPPESPDGSRGTR